MGLQRSLLLCVTPSIGVADKTPTLTPVAQKILTVRKARLDASNRMLGLGRSSTGLSPAKLRSGCI